MITAIDIGGTKIAAGIVDADGRVVSRLDCPTEPERGFPDGLRRIRDLVRQAARDAGAEITGIGIGCTGPVDPFTGFILNADTLPGWQHSDLAGELVREFGVPVALENDADAAALGEAAWGAGRGKRNFIYVTISTGIGVGVIVDGRLYRGVDGFHPEIGHHVIEATGRQCYCGANGCWESLASGPAMVSWMQAQAPGKYDDLTAPRIFALAEEGDPLAMRAVEREGFYVGVGLANLIMMFCPDAIALGGGVMKSGDRFMPAAREVIRRSCAMVPFEKTAVVDAALGPDTGLIGAACAWSHRFRAGGGR